MIIVLLKLFPIFSLLHFNVIIAYNKSVYHSKCMIYLSAIQGVRSGTLFNYGFKIYAKED